MRLPHEIDDGIAMTITADLRNYKNWLHFVSNRGFIGVPLAYGNTHVIPWASIPALIDFLQTAYTQSVMSERPEPPAVSPS